MTVFSTESVSRTLEHLRAAFQHAFTVRHDLSDLSTEELRLIDRLAQEVVGRGMAAPAVLFLESIGPMHFLGSQALHFLSPILDCAFQARDVERIATLLERRDALARLCAAIDARSTPTGAPAQ
jgi:hypothetical protein